MQHFTRWELGLPVGSHESDPSWLATLPLSCPAVQEFCSSSGGSQQGPGSSAGDGFASQLPAAASSFASFCRGALCECITREKPAALQVGARGGACAAKKGGWEGECGKCGARA